MRPRLDTLVLPAEIAEVSNVFKSTEPMARDSEYAVTLVSHLRGGMPEDYVKTVLGNPDQDEILDGIRSYNYFMGLSNILTLEFDQKGKLIKMHGTGVDFTRNPETIWSLMRLGMDQSEVNRHFDGKPHEIFDNGKTWQYKNDAYLYIITFDDNDKVSQLEKTELKTGPPTEEN